MPAEVIAARPASLKNCSVSKVGKTESPVGQGQGRVRGEGEPNFIRELKGKLSKVSKIDREELTRLQERKAHKKTELSSNRKKTKRDLGTAKSTAAMAHTQKTSQTNIALNAKTYSNVSCRIVDGRKKESVGKKESTGKKGDDRGASTH
jgi:hypothetical protein